MSERNMAGVIGLIQAAQRIALCCHVNPDGDALGSMLAVKLGLEALGKDCEAFCQDPVPRYLSFLPGAESVRVPEAAAGERFDLFLSVDVSDLGRMGRCIALMEQAEATAQLDHHGTNPLFMQENCVDAGASASAVLVYALMNALGVRVSRDMAICLYAGVTTDTGNFAFVNTTPEALRMTASLLEAGLPLDRINRLLYRQREKATLGVLGRALDSLRFYHDGQIAAMHLSNADFAAFGAGPEHAEGVVNYGLDVIGVKMAVLARETSVPGAVKLSLRAVEPLNIARVAQVYGGGGHAQAAGATMQGELLACVEDCVREMKKAIEEQSKDA